ncbi:hypothetical protein ZIOFF_033062 [Zingiber officinale]|uniref:Uncharacterized protein n=1 Tax=Zingiber officinale TaxID=94328 RepID=A0A8J5LC02_ZINOF|nr:hypothetical protein ZIOFF_033062 [Zingiber officinale]
MREEEVASFPRGGDMPQPTVARIEDEEKSEKRGGHLTSQGWTAPETQRRSSVVIGVGGELGHCELNPNSYSLRVLRVNDKRYWKYLPTEESRVFSSLEVVFSSLDGRYNSGLPSKRFGRRICNSEHIHGWDKKPVKFQLWTSNGQKALSQCSLTDPGSWINYHVGDFVVDKCDVPTKLKFSLTQIDCTHTKGGICVDSVFICPKSFM